MATVRVPMRMGSAQHLVEVPDPVTLVGIKEAAGKKFKDFKAKKGLAYHGYTGEELTEDRISSLFSGVGGAAVVLSMRPWKGAAKLKAPPSGYVRDARAECEEKGSICHAASILQGCDGLLVLVGAGMGVDSGLSTFRAEDGSYTKEEYMDLARHASFREDIHKAWAWHGAMLRCFRATPPHAGYKKVLEICEQVGDFFICTSNIDGAFLRCGFPADRLFEAHGSVHQWQCCDPRCNRNHNPWPAVDPPEDQLPTCRYCSDYARPNVAFFDDDLGSNARTFNSKHIDPQRGRFQRWLQAAGRRTVALLEIGCGCSEHSLRMTRRDGRDGWTCMSGEWKIPRLACPLVRIDPAEENHQAQADDFVHIQLGARDGLEQLASVLSRARDVQCTDPSSHPQCPD